MSSSTSSGTKPVSQRSRSRKTSTASSASPPEEPLQVIRFFEKALVHAKGRWAGQPFILEEWQRELLRALYGTVGPDGRRWYKEALIGVARKNGKSSLAAGLALYHLTIGGEKGGEVYSLAGSRDQAKIVFEVARAMVEASPLVARECHAFRSVIEHKRSGSVYRTLSADAGLAHGYNPCAAIVDELHVHPNGELYEAMKTATAARLEPIVISITTAGWDETSFCHGLYKKALTGEDPRLFFRWWAAPPGADPDDRAGWAAANPASWVTEEFLEAQLSSAGLHESVFRRLHLNQWTATLAAWLPHGAWDARGSSRRLVRGEELVLGFDGSFANDSTALVAATMDGHVGVVGAWERPPGKEEWQVDILEVEAVIREACRTYRVLEVACDPYRWQRTMQVLAEEGIPIVEYPTTHPSRMVPATAKFYDAVMGGRLSHDGDPRLARHVANAVVKTDRAGPRIVKDHKGSPRKIDLAVAAVVAFDRATQVREQMVRPQVIDLAAVLREAGG